MTAKAPLAALILLALALMLSASSQSEPELWLYGGGTYRLRDAVHLEYYAPISAALTLTLYRLSQPEQVLTLGGPRDLRQIEGLNLERLRSLRVTRLPASPWGTIALGQLPTGVYFAQLEAEGLRPAATLVVVTDLGLVVKTDADTVVTYTADLPTGAPRKSRVYLIQEGQLYAEGLADDLGLTTFTTAGSRVGEVTVAAKFGDHWVFADSYWQYWQVQRVRSYLVTDRPVYRPGEVVYLKGTVRSASGLRPLAGETAQLVVWAADGSELLRGDFVTDAYGSFATSLRLGAEPPLGSYSVEALVQGERSYTTFEVEAYVKPEYRVTVETEAVAVQGETAGLTVRAEYLFGGAVVGGQVAYAVIREPYFRFRYRSRYGFYQTFDDSWSYGGELIARGEGLLDENGELRLELPLPREAFDYRLSVQAGVSDEARREVQGSGSLVAYRASLAVDVMTDRYAYRAADPVTITVRTEDLLGRPTSAPFALELSRQSYARGVGRRVALLERLEGVTDAEGMAVLSTTLAAQGAYTLTLKVRDEAGRETESTRDIWVDDGSSWYWAYEGLGITVDKPEYAVGEVARFVVTSPVPDAYALVTLEGEALAKAEVIKLDGSLLTYELPITADMAPNGYLSVVIVGGGQIYWETAGFRVPPEDKFLTVEIASDAETYRPGDRGTFILRVIDAAGHGVRAQLTLGLVDEAIYLVRPELTPDIRGFFYALKENVVGTQLGSWFYFGQVPPLPVGRGARADMDEAVFGQAKAAFAPAEVREDFRDTILWLPDFETDDNGLGAVTVTFPDNLTEWRLTARAITLTDRVGQNTHTVRTSLPVIARLAAPRFFVRGDRADLRVIGQNTLALPQVGELRLEADGLAILNPEPQAVTLPAGGRASADFEVEAQASGTAYLTASALTPAASDALRRPVPVLPRGIRTEIGWADSGTSAWSFTLPPEADPAHARGTLYLTPSLLAAVAPALSYLAGYPYGCTEQTMSRFLPSVLAAQAGELARLPREIAADLDAIVEAGLRRIYDFQHEDGGWGFWQHDASSPFISAYVVMGLLEARDAGYAVREAVLNEGLAYLAQVVAAERFEAHRLVEADGKAYAYYALARAGRPIDGLAGLAGTREMSPYGLALSVLAFERAGRRVEANLYLDALLAQVTERDRVAYWETGAPRYSWNDDRVEATAYALEALARLRPEAPLVPKVVTWLLLQRRGAGWVATKDTAAVVKAALVLAEVTGEAFSEVTISVTLNGEPLATEVLATAGVGLEVPLHSFRSGRNQLAVTVLGQGTVFVSAGVSYVAERDTLTPDSEHFTLHRSYEALTPTYDEAAGRYLYIRQPLLASAVGDYVLVTVTLEPHAAYRYVIVSEPLPAGYRVIENDLAFRIAGVTPRYGWDYYGWNYWYDGRDVRDERIDYYFTALSGPVTFTYLLRAETPGVFTALPTHAFLMYEPEIAVTGVQQRLTVVP